jgi:hypothetical protein
VLFHFDQTQALAVELVEHGFDERGLARAPSTGQKRVVGGSAFDELARVLLDQGLLTVDAVKVRQADVVQIRNRLDEAVARGLAPAKRDARLPIHGARCGREQRFHALEQRFAALNQPFELRHGAPPPGPRSCIRR